jgi:hypothetical protein
MAMSNTTTVSYSISGNNFGGAGPVYSASVVNAAAQPPGSVNLASGFNSVTVPATALGVVIVPPSGNASSITLKGVTGDTGIPINPNAPTMLSWTAAQVGTVGITAGAAISNVTLLWM